MNINRNKAVLVRTELKRNKMVIVCIVCTERERDKAVIVWTNKNGKPPVGRPLLGLAKMLGNHDKKFNLEKGTSFY